LCGWGLELSDVGCYYLGLPFLKRVRCGVENTRQEQGETTYSLKLSQNILVDTVLVKVTFNGGDNLIYD